LRIARLRSRRASLALRSRWKRALSPVNADMVPKSSRIGAPPYVLQRTGSIVTLDARHSPALAPHPRGDKSLLRQTRTSCSSASL
jgi:hypothetical protein